MCYNTYMAKLTKEELDDIENLPKYYNVDDVLVKVDYDPKTDEVFGLTRHGTPYAPIKAAAEGRQITEEEFNS